MATTRHVPKSYSGQTPRREQRVAGAAEPPAGGQATLIYGRHPVHGLGWSLTCDMGRALSPDDYFIGGRRDSVAAALRAARVWVEQQDASGHRFRHDLHRRGKPTG